MDAGSCNAGKPAVGIAIDSSPCAWGLPRMLVRAAPGLPEAPFATCRNDIGFLPCPFSLTADIRTSAMLLVQLL